MSPRHKKPRRCGCPFGKLKGRIFKPSGIPMSQLEHITLYRDELEALRLCDFEDMTQEEAGKQMGVKNTVSRASSAVPTRWSRSPTSASPRCTRSRRRTRRSRGRSSRPGRASVRRRRGRAGNAGRTRPGTAARSRAGPASCPGRSTSRRAERFIKGSCARVQGDSFFPEAP